MFCSPLLVKMEPKPGERQARFIPHEQLRPPGTIDGEHMVPTYYHLNTRYWISAVCDGRGRAAVPAHMLPLPRAHVHQCSSWIEPVSRARTVCLHAHLSTRSPWPTRPKMLNRATRTYCIKLLSSHIRRKSLSLAVSGSVCRLCSVDAVAVRHSAVDAKRT